MVNKVILLGRIGSDPEVRTTADGTTVSSFSLATSETWKGKDGSKQEKTEWHRIVAWRRLGEIVGQYLKKGNLVYVEGKIQSREYDGKAGSKQKAYEIVINDMKMMPSGKNEGGSSSKPATQKQDEDFPTEDDLPM